MKSLILLVLNLVALVFFGYKIVGAAIAMDMANVFIWGWTGGAVLMVLATITQHHVEKVESEQDEEVEQM